jgi:hypothetical protein
VSETAILGIAGMIASLVGVGIGYSLQQRAESRRYLREACAKEIALALEATDHMIMAEVERTGGPAADPLRPEFRSDQYYALAEVGLVSKPLSEAAATLGDAVKAGISAQGSPNTGERAKGRQDVMVAIAAFEAAVKRETVAGRWQRFRGRS